MESGGRGRARARYLSWRWPWVGTGKKRAGKCRMGPRVGAPGQDSEYGASWAQDGEGGLRTPPASGERSMAANRHCKSARLGPGRARRDREEGAQSSGHRQGPEREYRGEHEPHPWMREKGQ